MLSDFLKSKAVEGHFRLSSFNPKSQETHVWVDKPNLIMRPSVRAIAQGLAGEPNSRITHLYLAYDTSGTYPAGGYTLQAGTTSFLKNADVGFLRIPITFAPSMSYADDGASASLTFHVLVNQPDSFITAGSPTLEDAAFFEAGLVVQKDPNNHALDLLFARVAFEKLVYDSAFNLTVSWGIKIIN